MNSEAKIQEEQFADILMELTMQYAELTDAHTFLLIETNSGRRFAGKRHLKDLYSRGELKPCGKDSEIIIDPSLSQLSKVSREKDEDMTNKEEIEIESRPRRHIGELPSERRERMRNEKKTYYKFVSMTQSVESSFGTFLMEAFMKYSCMTDVSIFFLIETTRARRFAGRKHLCDQYVAGQLAPSSHDIEMDLDTNVKVITEQPVATSNVGEKEAKISERNVEREAECEKEKGEEEKEDGKSDDNDRKRRESVSSKDSSVDQATKRKHQGELPSERRAVAIAEGRLRVRGPPPNLKAEVRKHKGELPSERKERVRREREGSQRPNGRHGEGPGYIFGPSTFPPATFAETPKDYDFFGGYGTNPGSYGTVYDYSSVSGTKASSNRYDNWKSGGTQGGGSGSGGGNQSQYG